MITGVLVLLEYRKCSFSKICFPFHISHALYTRYQDPKTGMPYATKEVFQVIRERYADENDGNRKVGMGNLSDKIAGQGFRVRRKRSMLSCHNEISYPRLHARLCGMPAADYEVSDYDLWFMQRLQFQLLGAAKTCPICSARSQSHIFGSGSLT